MLFFTVFFCFCFFWHIILSLCYHGSHKASHFLTKHLCPAIAVPERICQVLSIPIFLPQGLLFFQVPFHKGYLNWAQTSIRTRSSGTVRLLILSSNIFHLKVLTLCVKPQQLDSGISEM